MISPFASTDVAVFPSRPPLNPSPPDKSLVPFLPPSPSWASQEDEDFINGYDYRNPSSMSLTANETSLVYTLSVTHLKCQPVHPI